MRDDVPFRNIKKPAAHRARMHGNPEAIPDADVVRLLRLWPHEFNDKSVAGRKRFIALIERALREERRRCRAGHVAYDVARHATLSRLLKQQRAGLLQIDRKPHGLPRAYEPSATDMT
jgi:hypothetical protein